MNDKEKFLEKEKAYYGKIYVDITYAIDSVLPYLEPSTAKNRKYINKVNTVKKYIELIDSVNSEKPKGFLGIFKEDNSLDLLKDFKKSNQENLLQLEKCSECSCLKCPKDCKFDSCSGCRENSSIVFCDRQNVNLTNPTNFTINLTNDKTGKEDRFMVKATLQDCIKNQKYIVIDSMTSDDKFILYYYPGISEDKYGEINDEEEFDNIVSIVENNL
ncbi:DUF1292 domain-containing protein [Clostridium sp. 19966]|uniref:DUF1292 domain-containing protein n=1 Tax=Clostridium sp. 19966 TaxID=2768166 RepID=UPI0028DFE7EB|nr:DUF1292 domain-containing protein [Clostridium sp. 19966]MDT8716322.1 DUF1292 domain-containing protein [Clostridium sp. 19966]